MPQIPFSRFVVDAVPSDSLDDGIRVFPQPIPCRLCEDGIYRPFVKNTSGKFLARVAQNRASLRSIKVRSIVQPEELPQAKLEKVVFGRDSWVTVLRTRNNHQEFWTKNISASLLDQLRLVYEENMEIVDIAIGNRGAWFVHAVRPPSDARHLFFGGEISDVAEFKRILSVATSVQKVQFVGDANGWFIQFDGNSFAWRGVSEEFNARLEGFLCSGGNFALNQVVCSLDEAAWFLSITDRRSRSRSAFYGEGVSEEFIQDSRKFSWASEIYLGPDKAHFVRENDRTQIGNISDIDLVNFLR